jgi:tetraacyldisaccharide 4'-kinase
LALQRSTLEDFFTHAWARRGVSACLLLPLSVLFGLLSWLRRGLYRCGVLRAQRVAAPVIIVGNIFVGGTGKTPLTIWLVQALRAAGFHPGVISRGYGRKDSSAFDVHADASAGDAGDEPLLIAQRAQCPVMVGRDRVAVAQALLAAHPQVDVIVSDDGLQHYRLARDIEIVLSDARGVGNGWLLPAGPLRESASRRRDFSVVNVDPACRTLPDDAFRMQLAGEVAVPLSAATHASAATARPLDSLRAANTNIVAAAGIGNPARFFNMLRAAGLQFDELPLPDHHDFSVNPFAQLEADIILMTEKDAVKCRQSDALRNDPRLWVVPVAAHLDGALAEKIVEKLRGHSIT